MAEIKGRDDLTEEPPRFLEIANVIFIISALDDVVHAYSWIVEAICIH